MTITTSTIEIEYVEKYNANKEIYFLKMFLQKFDFQIEVIELKTNNQSIIKLINNFVNHVKTKHISIQYHYVRELMTNEHIKLTYVNIKKMLTNDLIKSLKSYLFKNFVRMLKLIADVKKRLLRNLKIDN